MWASFIWDSDTVSEVMEKAIRAQTQLIGATMGVSKAWDNVIGPAGALIVTAQRINWQVIAHDLVIDHRGRQIDMRSTCPFVIGTMVDEATEIWLHRQVAHQLKAPVLSNGIWLEPVRAMVHDKKLKARDRAHLRSTVVGAQWTQADKAEAQLVADPFCKKCEIAHGTLQHRHWECHATFMQRMQFFNTEHIPLQAAFAEREREVFWNRGLCPHPRQTVEATSEESQGIVWTTAPEDGTLEGELYTDGARTQHKYKWLSAATCGFAQIAEGQIVAEGNCHAAHVRKTSPVAEMMVYWKL